MLSPYLREQATIYDCRLSIINSYKLLLLLAVCLAAKAGTEREREREKGETDKDGVGGEGKHNTLHLCVRAAADNIKQSA